MHDLKRRRREMRGGLVAIVAAVLSLGLITTASAGKPGHADKPSHAGKPSKGGHHGCNGRGVPTNKISIQEWTFADYIGFGTDAATIARLEEVLGRLSEMGYRNIELFTLSGLTAEQMRALLDEYDLKARSRHVDVGTPENPADIDAIIADNRTLGIKFFGSGATPIFRRSTPPRRSGSRTPST